MKDQTIYTDGACSGNPGPGGYSCIFPTDEDLVIYGGKKITTNNHMELKAIERGLKYLVSKKADEESRNLYERKKKLFVTINTDSAYIVNAINQGWIDFWKQNNWKTKSNTEIKNVELWKSIYEYISLPRMCVTFVKVKGHNGDKYNEKADYYAKLAIKEMMSKEA